MPQLACSAAILFVVAVADAAIVVRAGTPVRCVSVPAVACRSRRWLQHRRYRCRYRVHRLLNMCGIIVGIGVGAASIGVGVFVACRRAVRQMVLTISSDLSVYRHCCVMVSRFRNHCLCNTNRWSYAVCYDACALARDDVVCVAVEYVVAAVIRELYALSTPSYVACSRLPSLTWPSCLSQSLSSSLRN